MKTQSSGYVIDEANAELLTCWLDAAQWTRREATLLFLDIDPDRESVDRFSTFSRLGEVQYEYYDDDDPQTILQYGVDEYDEPIYLSDEQSALVHKTRRLCKRIGKRLNLYDMAKPHEWVELACNTGITIPWLGWANSRGLFIQKLVPDEGLNGSVAKGAVSESRPVVADYPEPMTKAAMMREHKHEWPTIEQDMKDANRNGLSAVAKAGQRGWVESKAMEWARANAKLTGGDKPQSLLDGAVNKMASLPTTLKHICED